MPSFNRVQLMGNLTREPELRQVGQSNVTLARLGLAINERRKDKNGQWVDVPCFIDVDVWDRVGELCGQHLHKGSPVFVEGVLQQDTWEKDGQRRTKHKVRAITVKFLAMGQRQDNQAQSNVSAAEVIQEAEPVSTPVGDLAKDDEDVPF